MKRGGGLSGVVSLVMIFCVLCLSVFAVLTLATADRERRFSELNAERAAAYYAADAEAARIVSALSRGEQVDQELTYIEENGERCVEFSIPAGGEQSLDVLVRLTDRGCEVRRWAMVYSGDWAPNDALIVWDGN